MCVCGGGGWLDGCVGGVSVGVGVSGCRRVWACRCGYGCGFVSVSY